MEKSSQIAWKIVPLRHFFSLEVVPLIEVFLYTPWWQPAIRCPYIHFRIEAMFASMLSGREIICVGNREAFERASRNNRELDKAEANTKIEHLFKFIFSPKNLPPQIKINLLTIPP
jgi:hypothetical protein